MDSPDTAGILQTLESEEGMSKRDIARVAGATDAQVRSWRRGEPAEPRARRRLVRLAAFLQRLRETGLSDPASWMETALPLPPGYYIRPLDLYRADTEDTLVQLLVDPYRFDTWLEELRPGWRDERSASEVVDGPVDPESGQVQRVIVARQD